MRRCRCWWRMDSIIGVAFANQKFRELIGYTSEEIQDLAHWWPLAYPDPAYREAAQGALG